MLVHPQLQAGWKAVGWKEQQAKIESQSSVQTSRNLKALCHTAYFSLCDTAVDILCISGTNSVLQWQSQQYTDLEINYCHFL